jgi:ribosome biogenesis protein ERB1
MEWYDDFPHIGYDIDGKRVLRPAKGDELEKFLSTMDDPDSWRSVTVDKEGKDVVLNDEELDIIRRIQGGDIPDAAYDPYEPTIEWFSSKKEVMPLSAAPEPKSRFIPSKWEAKKVLIIANFIVIYAVTNDNISLDHENCACYSYWPHCPSKTCQRKATFLQPMGR